MENIMEVFIPKFKIELLYDPAISLLDISFSAFNGNVAMNIFNTKMHYIAHKLSFCE